MKIIGNIFYGLFIALLLGVTGLFLATLMPIPGTIEVKIVKSGSMSPAIPTGALVVIKPSASYVVGDVITFGADTKAKAPTTHRIVSVRGAGSQTVYIVKGDANEEPDPNEVAGSTVIGKVVASVPYAGYVLDFARRPLGFALLIGLPAGIIILEELFTIVTEVANLRRRRRGPAVPQKPAGRAPVPTHARRPDVVVRTSRRIPTI